MQLIKPNVREAGSGPAVVCIHASASAGGQWRALMERLADRFRVIAVDLYGCGRTPAWPGERPMRLEDEVALLEPVFAGAGERFHLVGHSYGGAVALKAALAHRERLASLVLFEPVLFSALVAEAPRSDAAREIVAIRDDTTRLVGEGRLEASAERFIDYWMGKGAWEGTPAERRGGLAQAMRSVIPQWQAAFGEPAALRAIGAIDVPVLLLTGARSKASARAVTRLVAGVLPRVSVEELPDAGHMAPVTQPDKVNPLIDRFLGTSTQEK